MQDARQSPVDPDRCVLCKKLEDEWSPDVCGHDVGDDEQICENCLGDLRMYKRTSNALLFVNDAFGEDVARVFFKHHKAAMAEAAEMVDDHAPPNVWLSWSNARSRRRLDLEGDVAEVDEEALEEFRESFETDE